MNDASPADPPAPPRPLEGLRVIDLTSVVMGPYATQILADYGADVIKVEPPDGDVMRKPGPMRTPDMGPIHHQLNRNKRGVVLDLKQEAGRAAMLRMCQGADVVVTNVRPAAMRRLGLSYADVRTVNPGIVYASLVGYGEAGPYAGRPAYDDLVQGLCALPVLFARAGGERPRYVPSTLSDRIVGISAAHAILAAIVSRDRTGKGAHVEVPMFETLAQFVLSDHMGGRTFEPAVGPTGYGRLLSADRRPFETSDGFVCVLLYTTRHWEAFFRCIGRGAEYESDPRLNDLSTRTRHYDEVYRRVAEIVRTRTTREWLELLQEHDIPCVPLHGLDDLVEDEHLAAVGFFERLAGPDGGLTLVGVPTRWNGARLPVRRPAPLLGEHSVEVLAEAGLTAREVEVLVSEGATIDGRGDGGHG